jgi:hypothetical protein
VGVSDQDQNPQPANRELSAGFIAAQFKPGESGNPSGRPKKKLLDYAIEEELAALDSAEAKAIAKAIVQLAKKDVQAAKLIAERTEGKPIQKVEHSGPDGGAMQGVIRVEFVKA